MAKESKGYGWPILGIVAIVAVVGLVWLFAQKTAVTPTLTEEEQALAGEAMKVPSKIQPIQPVYVTLDKLNKAMVYTLEDNTVAPYRSCTDLCRENGRICIDSYHQELKGPWTPSACSDIVGTDPIKCRCY